MAILSGTSAKVALDLLRSGRAFEKDGVKMFERALKATQRGQVPEGAVSEFRKLVDILKAQTIYSRRPRKKHGERLPTLQKDYKGWATWWLPSSGLEKLNYLKTGKNVWRDAAEEIRREINNLNVPAYSSWRVDGTGMRPAVLDKKLELQQELQYRNHMAALTDALISLFGDAV
jgi:hypothetical protein